ncbi:MAG: helix-turn-helix domain-containing protein [Candidatus Margulisbacteria bacterium]|jgi:transcriptional regulator with XRE-family HTH domain|nr:helix-turn-helix domain-containing protein [Candidatus Margulisiibacteriota bacterium]
MDGVITDGDLKLLISRKLRLLREKSKKTLENTAEDLNLDYAQYCRMLKGNSLPHLVTLANISKFYNLDINWWFKGLEERAPDKARIYEKAVEFELASSFKKLDMQTKEIILGMINNLTRKRKKYTRRK